MARTSTLTLAALALAAAAAGAAILPPPAQAGPRHEVAWRHWRGRPPPWRYGYRYWPGYPDPYAWGYPGPWWWGGWYPYAPYGPPLVYEGPPYPPPPVYDHPPPRRPAPPAAEEPERFVVYFPFDRDAITPDARQTIRAAAAYQHRVGGRVIVVGHTDTRGSEAYNQALSERRARAVRAALGEAGVDLSGVEMDWRGKHDLAVDTGDNVRERRNRRVTILVERRG